ncbi:MAG TPA: SUMF1/EgtB/PvdO family nonheme iron enzyme, partial [bacterium]|nr:SUMF1/EgtB/PvdO family nonheme iron enzyme [bacterium]
AEGVVNIDGDYAMIGSGRDTIYYEDYPMQYSGFDIYTLNLKTKREEKWTPEIKGIFEGNSIRPSFEYPYFHFVSNETDETYGGGSFALNIETGVVTPFWEGTGDQWCYIKDRHILMGSDYRHGLSKLLDLPRLPENADAGCNDKNVCTDNRYFVTDGKCHFIPNHERCDDKDDSTLLDVCIDGTCQGYEGAGTDDGMVEIPAGTFIYDGLEFEITNPFMMDIFEVTNSDYAKCVESKACVPPLKNRSLTEINYYGNPLYDNYPVLYVNQYEAQIYCNWLGKRLPTEFEWMKAAWDGTEKTYLWGEEVPTYTNYYARTTTGFSGAVGYDVVEVGTFPIDKTVSGIMDMSGNVAEWTTSEWSYDLCETPPCEGYFGSDMVVVKGGGTDMGPELKTRHPFTPWTHSFYTGIRCMKDVK